MNKLCFAVCASLALGCAAAQTAADDPVRYLAATCSNCHGITGRSTGAIPSIAGLPKNELVEKMHGFRDGTRSSTVMHQIAKGYTDPQIEQLANFFSSRPSR